MLYLYLRHSRSVRISSDTYYNVIVRVLFALNYTLVVCEKPDAARRIAHALGRATESRPAAGVSVFDVQSVVVGVGEKSIHYKVCSASGHLYGVSDPTKNRSVYPVFDLEWAPVAEKNRRAAKIIGVISKLSKEAGGGFVHACDYDQEGEVIGYSILQYACGNRYSGALRAKFSTLTDDEIRESFANLQKPSEGLAQAGRARHLLDFIYGVNLSRALAQSFNNNNNNNKKGGNGGWGGGGGYRNLSIGRVQGPTLAFAADREQEIRLHVPDPYWTIAADFEVQGEGGSRAMVHAGYEKPKIEVQAEAQAVLDACTGRDGTVSRIDKDKVALKPPTPFNIGDLQREAYRLFKVSPGYTLAVAEKLYLRALISYPRTASQKLPPSINYRKILDGLASASYGREVSMLLLAKRSNGRLAPHEGAMSDPAHPAIYPTGLAAARRSSSLSGLDFKIYDLIARRFLATFGDPALTERVRAEIVIENGDNSYRFLAEGRATLYDGWMALYRPYVNVVAEQPGRLPSPLAQGQVLANRQVKMEDKFTQPPWRYSQASLLAKMEQEQIGTKATRADIIATLFKREYLAQEKGGTMVRATDLGLAVVESMKERVPAIVSTALTRSMEEQLEKVEEGEQDPAAVVEYAAEKLVESLAAFRKNRTEIGRQIRQEMGGGEGGNGDIAAAAQQQATVIGRCPLCKTGSLRMIRSKTTKKRFVGCSNYSPSTSTSAGAAGGGGGGCRASAPLPQKGTVRSYGKVCSCGWPIVWVAFGRGKKWNMCVNVQCPHKKKAGS